MMVRSAFLISWGIIVSGAVVSITYAQVQGSIRYADVRCGLGITEPGHPDALPQGAECLRTDVSDNEALGLECDGIQNPVVISKCDGKMCVAKIGCDGKPLTGVPETPVEGGGSGSSGGSAGSGGTPSGGGSAGTGGTLPSGSDPLDAFDPPSLPNPTPTPAPAPSPAPTPGVPGGTSPGGIPLPDVVVVDGPTPTPGGSGTPAAPGAGTPNPAPGWNPGTGAENGWLYPGSTFGSGATVGSSFGSTGQNLITAVFSNLVGNLFGRLFDTGSASRGTNTVSPQPNLRPSVLSTSRGFLPDDPDDPINRAITNTTARDANTRPGTGIDRTGFENIFPPQGGGSITGSPPGLGGFIISPQDLEREAPPRSQINPTGVTVADARDPGVINDSASVIVPNTLKHPDWWTPEMVAQYANGVRSGLEDSDAYQGARGETISAGLAGLYARTTAPDSPEGKILRRLLEEDVRIARQTRDRAYLESSFGFLVEWADQYIGVTAGQRALNAATDRLNLLGELEGRYDLTDSAGGAPQPSVEIVVTDQPVAFDESGAINLFDVPGMLATRGFDRIRAWWGGTPAAVETPTTVVPTEEPQGAPTPQPAPQVESPEPSSFLERLSAVADRVREALGIAVPPQTPEATPTPPGSGTAAPTPTASAGNRSFSQMSMALLNALIQSLSTLLSPAGNDSGGSEATTPAQNPTQITAAAAIAANPNEVPKNMTTALSWSSVGAGSCAIVDSLLNVIARGTVGATTSPALSETTRFGIICDITGGEDKFLNEVLVRVTGSASTTPPLFSNSGRVSTAAPFSNSGGAGGTSGESPTAAPIDVRTCDPEQDINSFIRCLCEAEPNPAGCAIPPGGV